ncbi:Bro-N domain-containing protein [Enterovibrio calviensis]|uniref:BRO-N domain-containing protein n=1 Tax=Enterovibrio calviensis TaxID=91359 RepID=UPI003735CDD2
MNTTNNTKPKANMQPTFMFYDMPVRTVMQPDEHGENQTWFVATDVAKAMGYRDASELTRLLDGDEKAYTTLYTSSGNQKVVIISEDGLYTGMIRSRKPEAKYFRKWVTETVSPSIRKHGGYIHGMEKFSPEVQQKVMAIMVDQFATEADRIEKHLRNKLRRADERSMRRLEAFTRADAEALIAHELRYNTDESLTDALTVAIASRGLEFTI